MSRWDQRYFGYAEFPETLTALEIQRFFTPTQEERLAVAQRRSVTNKIAFALQLGFLKMTGRSLNSAELVPPAILAHLGEVLGCAPPRIASIRAFYRRRRTLFDHQAEAQALLGRTQAGEHALRGLTAYLRREAIGIYTVADLSAKARIWMIERDYILPRERDIRQSAVKALRVQEQALAAAVYGAVERLVREAWPKALLGLAPNDETTVLEWFRAPPASHRVRVLDDHLAKVRRLRELGADLLTPEVLPLSGLNHFHRRIAVRKPAQLSMMSELVQSPWAVGGLQEGYTHLKRNCDIGQPLGRAAIVFSERTVCERSRSSHILADWRENGEPPSHVDLG